MAEITLPNNWIPRDYQMPLWSYLENGGKRAVAIWHRRAGKDLTAINYVVTSMIERPGLYWHLLPTYNQGRKIVWDGMDRTGRPFLDAFPNELIKGNPNNTDMKLETVNGSMYQVVGTDWVDRLVGANPVGCVFSEYSLQDPRAWDLIRPILLENKGWAMFVYTPRGKNHGYNLFKTAQQNSKSWFSQVLTINDTGIITPEEIHDERMSGMSDELIQQEFYCSFEAGIPGAYFSVQVLQAKREGRFCGVPVHVDVPVDTYWDLGMDDSMSIWFAQDIGKEIHMIDYMEGAGEGLPYYAKELAKKPYLYGRHYAPHDIKVRELGSGKSRRDTAKRLGIDFRVAKKVNYKEEAIEMARNIFPLCWFDSTRCARGIDALENYKKEYDDKKKVFMSNPVHDWAAHGADAFMTMAATHEFKNYRTGNILYHPGHRRQIKIADSIAGY
jgi:hypothetical protein